MSMEDLIKSAYGSSVNNGYDLFKEIQMRNRKQVDSYIGNNVYRKVMYKVSRKYRTKVAIIITNSNINKDGYMTFNIVKGVNNE